MAFGGLYALSDNVLVAHKLDGAPLPRAHGGSLRAVVPDLYFELPRTRDDQALARSALRSLEIDEAPPEIYRASEEALDIQLAARTLHANPVSGVVEAEGQTPCFFLRVANSLHLNRGKKAWSYIADLYAVLLIFLAVSRLFMIPGRKGLLGRGALIASIGAATPVLYVVLSGAP